MAYRLLRGLIGLDGVYNNTRDKRILPGGDLNSQSSPLRSFLLTTCIHGTTLLLPVPYMSFVTAACALIARSLSVVRVLFAQLLLLDPIAD